MAKQKKQQQESSDVLWWITINDIIKRTNLCRRTIEEEIKSGRLKASKRGEGKRVIYRIRIDHFEQWFSEYFQDAA